MIDAPKRPGRKRPRKRPPLRPAPEWSAHVYVRVPQSDSRLFRYLLEGYDNLAYTSVIDRREAVFRVAFCPWQREEALAVLRGIAESVSLDLLPIGL